jgi:hypothetical protein
MMMILIKSISQLDGFIGRLMFGPWVRATTLASGQRENSWSQGD